MGGFGSGNWYRSDPKTTVESCLSLNVKTFKNQLGTVGSAGVLKWTWAETDWRPRRESAALWSVEAGGFVHVGFAAPPILNLKDRLYAVRIKTESSPMRFGGVRWWWRCPECNGRVTRLFLPGYSVYFKCRKCHDLAYRSSQEAHKDERIFARLGIDADTGKWIVEAWARDAAERAAWGEP